MSTLLLVDGKNLLWRNAAVLNLSSGAELTGGVHGFMRCLMKVYEQYAGHVTICWDDWENGPAERKALYPDYKKRKPDEKRDQLVKEVLSQQTTIFALLKSLGIRQTRAIGWEADDVMGTLARKWPGEVVIYTGDRDLLQCVDEKRVAVLRPAKDGDAFYRARDVEKEFGVSIKQFVDYKALVGDVGDNIPGCEGIGPVAAKALLSKYGKVEHILACAFHDDWAKGSGLPQRYADLLKVGHDSVLLSKKLATINTHVELRHRRGELNHIAAKQLLREHQMVQLLTHFSQLSAMRWHDDA